MKSAGLHLISSTTVVHEEMGSSHFSLFTRLPAELRYLIWRFAIPGPRVISIKPAVRNTHGFIIASEVKTAKFKAVTSVPAMLHAAHESRTVALKYYDIAFEEHPKIPTMFFSYDQDYLHLNIYSFVPLFSGTIMSEELSLHKVRNIMMCPVYRTSYSVLDAKLSRVFKSLKRLIIPHTHSYGDVRRVRTEHAGKHYFKELRKDHGVAIPGVDVEYKTIMIMSWGILVGD
ncbi:uncharacterized protein RSE6_12487 [Rhynchosporium secalis]|uniref:2EXR domain-containing protein n=1 Tax=Rhynchosporium secalis TaxID=38038 RepID=A0A1E1MRF9_RHYSE|nr:uncharacterized protein RSE6_12487 [Rhynchosporium secalis]